MISYAKKRTQMIDSGPRKPQIDLEDHGGKTFKVYRDERGNVINENLLPMNSGMTDTERLQKLFAAGAENRANIGAIFGEDPAARAERIAGQQYNLGQVLEMARMGGKLSSGANPLNLDAKDVYQTAIDNASLFRQNDERKAWIPKLLELAGAGADMSNVSPEKVSLADILKLSSENAKRQREQEYINNYNSMLKMFSGMKKTDPTTGMEMGSYSPDELKTHIMDILGPRPGQNAGNDPYSNFIRQYASAPAQAQYGKQAPPALPLLPKTNETEVAEQTMAAHTNRNSQTVPPAVPTKQYTPPSMRFKPPQKEITIPRWLFPKAESGQYH